MSVLVDRDLARFAADRALPIDIAEANKVPCDDNRPNLPQDPWPQAEPALPTAH